MEVKEITNKKLFELLLDETKMSISELAAKIGISRPTLYRYMNDEANKLQAHTKNKVNKFLSEHDMTFRIRNINNSHVEINQIKEPEPEYKQRTKDDVYVDTQILINKLLKENFELKEKIAKLEQQLKKDKP